jgi:CRP-like cAMP-binding protein
MLCSEELLKLELFRQLKSDRLEWICDRATEIQLMRGDILVKEGDPHRGFFILTSGTINITRLSEGVEMPIGQHRSPSFFGEIQIMTEEILTNRCCVLTQMREEIKNLTNYHWFKYG